MSNPYAVTASYAKSLSNDDLLSKIEECQSVQKRHEVNHFMWRDASLQLEPLFTEMARRQREGLL